MGLPVNGARSAAGCSRRADDGHERVDCWSLLAESCAALLCDAPDN
jgi:hypothetical protein